MTIAIGAGARVGVLLAALLLSACAGVPTERGRNAVGEQLAARSGTAITLPERGPALLDDAVRARLAEPLSADDAVAIAWLLGPRTRTALARLGLAAADLFDAQRPRNPRLSLGRIGNGEHRETAFGLHVVLTDLLTLPVRRRIGDAEWQAAIADTVAALLAEANEVRRAYYRYLAAEQIATLRAAITEAAEISEELAQRFHAAGNISALQLAREQAHASEARIDLAAARAARLEARMALAERLGLAGRSNRWRLPERLPLPVAEALVVDELLERAHAQRADLIAARAGLDAGRRAARLSRRIGWLGRVELGVEHEREGGERRSGPNVELELPLFRQGQGEVARAEAREELALQHAERIGLAIERDVRTAVARLATRREIVDTYRHALIPQREAIVARELERYNFMLVGVFDLLQARRREFDAYQQYLEAIRDYWIARSDLEHAVGGDLPLPATPELTPRADEIVTPQSGDAHSDHGQPATDADTPHGDHR